MSKQLKESTGRVLITGASGGIGSALARRFARAGHDLVLVDLEQIRLEALSKELTQQHGVKAIAIAVDLTADDAVRKLAETLARQRLDIEILVNNAGVNHQGRFSDMTPQQHQQIIRLNISASTDMLAQFIPPMVKRGHGRVLITVGAAAFLPLPFMATYAASKAYLLSLTESLSEELTGTGITISALCPGVTATPMTDSVKAANPKYARIMSPTVSSVEKVAEAGYDACIHGQVIRVPGGVTQLITLTGKAMPSWMTRRVVGFLSRMSM